MKDSPIFLNLKQIVWKKKFKEKFVIFHEAKRLQATYLIYLYLQYSVHFVVMQ